LPKQRTTLLFSATFSTEIKRLAGSYLQDPVTIEVARPNETASTVIQQFFSVGDEDKRRALKSILKQNKIGQAFVFVNSKLGCARLARSLDQDGLKTTALHGDKSQDERLKALEAFKGGEVDLLICTDVAARGLDIKDVPAVFNFDLPFNAEDYVHRIGRTGRAGASGLAVSFVSASDQRLVTDIEKILKKKIEIRPMELDDEFRRDASRGARRDHREARENSESRDTRSSREGRGYRDDEPRGSGSKDQGHTPSSWGASRYSSRSNSAPKDPFFDKPYEPSASAGQAPSWEVAEKPTARSISANIKPKRKVAALFKSEEA